MTLRVDHITISKRQIRVLSQGSGPPLVLVHGIGVSADWWLPILPALAQHYTTYAMDLPGHGASRGAITARDLEAPEALLAALLDELGLEPISLVGHSMGGYVAARYALYRPSCVKQLVLVDSAGFGNLSHRLLRAMTIPILGEMSFVSPSAAYDFFIGTLCYDASRVPSYLYMDAERYARNPDFQSSFLCILRFGISASGHWKRNLLLHDLVNYKGPLMIIWGEDDPVFSVRQADSISCLLPQANVHVFSQCGHMPQVEYPDQFSDILLSFLERTSKQEASSAFNDG